MVVVMKYAVVPRIIPAADDNKISNESSVRKYAKTDSVMHPDAFIIPMSRILLDIAVWTRKDVIIGPVMMFSVVTIRINWENML